jgi:hypothetical protein
MGNAQTDNSMPAQPDKMINEQTTTKASKQFLKQVPKQQIQLTTL